MPKVVTRRTKSGKNRLSSFSMVELLVIMAIIGILTAITLGAVSGLMAIAARNRAHAEIKGMEASLDGFKTDNGAYPISTGMATNQYTLYDGSGTSTAYITSAQTLYQAISGKTNFLDVPAAGVITYGSFKVAQLGNSTSPAGATGANTTFVQDPWTYAYGYSTATLSGTTSVTPYNGQGFYDLWSTAGLLASKPSTFTNTAAWISNWQN